MKLYYFLNYQVFLHRHYDIVPGFHLFRSWLNNILNHCTRVLWGTEISVPTCIRVNPIKGVNVSDVIELTTWNLYLPVYNNLKWYNTIISIKCTNNPSLVGLGVCYYEKHTFYVGFTLHATRTSVF